MRKSNNSGNMFLQKFLRSKSSSNKGDKKSRGVLKDVSMNVQDEDRDDRDYSYSKHLSMGGTSFTSGFNSMFHKNQNSNNKSKNNSNSNNGNGELVGISEEYDIQTVVSGLTRDSQFVDSKDPPASNSFDNRIENIQDISAQWPDDEASCHQHIIVQITDEGQLVTKSDCFIHQQSKKKEPSRQNQNKCMDMNMNMNLTNISSSGSEPIGRRWDSPPTKKENNNVMSYYTSQRGEETCNMNDYPDGYEVVLSSSEPDGIKFGVNNDDTPKIPVEPAGKKVGTKSRSTSSSISIAVLPDDRDVEVVYGEKEMEIREGPVKEEPSPRLRGRSISRNTPRRYGEKEMEEIREGPVKVESSPRLRGRSTGRNTPRRSRTNMIPWMTADGNRNNNNTGSPKVKNNDSSTFDNAKKRSRSLPRTLRRLTSRYLKSPQGSKSNKITTTEIKTSQPKDIVVEDEIVSSLGSHLDGCESPHFIRTPKFEMKLPNQSMDHRNFPATSSHEVCENFEPKVCVEFSRRESGGYFQTTCYADETSSDLFQDNAGKTNKSLRYMKNVQESHKNEEVDTSTTATPGRPFEVSSRDRKLQAKVQVRAITEEASKNLLLGSNIKEESYLFDEEEELVVERLCSASSTCNGSTENLDNRSAIVKEDPPIESSACTKQDSSIYPVMTDLKYQSALPVSPSPDKEFIHELSTSCVSNDTYISSLAKTPAGRRSLIKKYISLRASLRENQIRVPGSISESMSLNNTTSSMNSARSRVTDNVEESSYTRKYETDETIGYDDASRYYHPVNPTQSLCSTSTSRLSQSSMVKEIFPERRATIDIDATKISFNTRGDSVDMVDDYNVGSTRKKICTPSPSLIRHVSPQQALSSYSFLSDDDSSSSSSVHDTYKPVSPSPALFSSNYESPHHQFMKMKLGLSPQSVLGEFHI
jgi:hypothetical protein